VTVFSPLPPFTEALILLFLLSLLSNATPFFGASYTFLATTELVANGINLDSFGLVVFVTALGATLGKIIIYAGAKGFQRNLRKNRNVKLLGRWLGKSSFYLALFVTALIPALPLDDYVYLGAGANNARLAPMQVVTFLAKLVKSAFEILLELSGVIGFTNITYHILGLSRLDVSILLSAATVIIGVVIYKIDWETSIVWARRSLRRLTGRPTVP
jgi:hypothetical protein